jgi:thiamine-phosphate pyrophosphorylase
MADAAARGRVLYPRFMSFVFPKIYPILDSSILPSNGREAFLRQLGESLTEAGVTLLEYRNKTGSDAQVLADARILRKAAPKQRTKLILDDRAHLVEESDFDGVHVDAGDLTPGQARNLLGPARIVGTFGGSEALVAGALSLPADYLSIGPVFPTTTKQTSKAPIGSEGVRRLRKQAGNNVNLIAVGGIGLGSAQEILAAGATTIAVSAAIFRQPDPAAEFRRWMDVLG